MKKYFSVFCIFNVILVNLLLKTLQKNHAETKFLLLWANRSKLCGWFNSCGRFCCCLFGKYSCLFCFFVCFFFCFVFVFFFRFVFLFCYFCYCIFPFTKKQHTIFLKKNSVWSKFFIWITILVMADVKSN